MDTLTQLFDLLRPYRELARRLDGEVAALLALAGRTVTSVRPAPGEGGATTRYPAGADQR